MLESGTFTSHSPALRLARDIVMNTPLPMLLACSDGQRLANAPYTALFGAPAAGSMGPAGTDPASFARARAGASVHLTCQMLSVGDGQGAHELAYDLYLTPVRDEQDKVAAVICTLAPGAPGNTAAPSGPASLRILVVEDNLDSQYLVCEMLKAFGHDTDGVGDGESALTMLAGAPYQVLFSDLSLPGISGIELARRALCTQPALQVIFASGYGDSLLDQVEFPHQSLQKPYELEHLQAALARIATELGLRN